jgi:hypothetical protein
MVTLYDFDMSYHMYPHAFLKNLPNEIFSNHHQSYPNISQAH